MKGDFTRNTFDRKKHYSSVRMQQGRVQLDADWNEQADIQTYRRRTADRDLMGACGGPKGVDSNGKDLAGFKIVAEPNQLRVTSGRYYADGILCENEQDLLIKRQPGSQPIFGATTARFPTKIGTHLVYLDVWERHITALDDPEFREIALGVADTTTRTEVVWEVRIQENVDAAGVSVDCDAFANWTPPGALSTGRLKARLKRAETETGPCDIPGGEYHRLENQLYRVEIHKDGNLSDATFKWSRDNGTCVACWTGQEEGDGKELTLGDAAPQQLQGFQPGQWIEVTDDTHERRGKRGVLAQLLKVEGNVLTIDPDTVRDPDNPAAKSIDRNKFAANPKVRRWDSDGAVTMTGPGDAQWIELEEDIQVLFDSGTYHTGDYWLIPARTLIDNVLWPVDAADNPIFRPPDGIEHHYCPLALVTWERRAVRRLVSLIEGDIKPGLAESWEVSEDGLTWTFKLVMDVKMADGTPLIADVVKEILKDKKGSLSGYKDSTIIDDYTIQVVLRKVNPRFLVQLSRIPVIRWKELVVQVEDCRPDFPPLTDIRAENVGVTDTCQLGVENLQQVFDTQCKERVLRYVSGDGQEGPPDTELPGELIVGVEDGFGRPQPDVEVTFTVETGGGTVTPVTPITDSYGLARCRWTLGPDPGENEVLAELATPGHAHLPVRFHAMAVRPETWPTIVKISWKNDQPMSLKQFNEGLKITFSESMNGATVSLDTFIVTLELVEKDPFGYFRGHRPFIVQGKVEEVEVRDGSTWLFKPVSAILSVALKAWLDVEREIEAFEGGGIRCRVVLKANAILDKDGKRPLDGDAFGQVASDPDTGKYYTDLILPSGDGNKGGDFESWFYLVEGPPSPISWIVVNTATLAELETLPGIGPVLAGAIVENRPYNTVEELLKVPGIGAHKLDQLRELGS